VAVVADWGNATVSPAMWEVLEAAADQLIAATGMVRVDGVDTSLPRMGAAWSISGAVGTYASLASYWPECKGVLTPEIKATMRTAIDLYNLEARVKLEDRRMEFNERMAAIFSEVDLVMTASNPDVAFAAEGPLPSEFGGLVAGPGNNGRLTFPANMHGNPAVSVPAGTVDGLPVGLQIVGRHHAEQLLLDAALVVERTRPWPLVAPSVVTQ
jgi:aspartyl-tRNA(Asn)/glutamyl-tRNA(Gln) amidotransferase subunit A